MTEGEAGAQGDRSSNGPSTSERPVEIDLAGAEVGRPRRTARPGTTGREANPLGETDDDQPAQLIDNQHLELVLTGAKLLVFVVYLSAVITFAILTLGFVLLVFGASPEAPFVEWAYRSTEEAMKPFRGMFPVREIDGRSVFDPSLLFAAALYGLVAIGLHAVVGYLSTLARRLHRETELEAARTRT